MTDSDADLVGPNRSSMDSSGPYRVGGDSGSRPNSPTSVDGGQASHSPSMNYQGQGTEGAMDILQQIAQALQRATQPCSCSSTVSHRENGKISTRGFPWEER